MERYGGKRKVARAVWERFGADVENYIEPFYGSGAVLLGRPGGGGQGFETANDKDGFVSNAWRAIKMNPEETARWADNPIFENDLHARHAWLTGQRHLLARRLEGDPDYYDAKVAGWWIWGVSSLLGGALCSGEGPWYVNEEKMLIKRDAAPTFGDGIKHSMPTEGIKGVNKRDGNLPRIARSIPIDGAKGVNRRTMPHGEGDPPRVARSIPIDSHQGVNRATMPHGEDGRGRLFAWFDALSKRLRHVRVCCGDWARVLGKTPERGPASSRVTAIFFDPPYADTAERSDNLYAQDSFSVAHEVREWAIEMGKQDRLRIALCGYEGEHQMPPDWEEFAWYAGVGKAAFSNDPEDRVGQGDRERIWFSPGCLKPRREMSIPGFGP